MTPGLRRDFRHTKIVCTLGPASSRFETVADMARAGMNVARLNMSHGSHEWHGESIARVKGLNRQLDQPIATLLDLQGPELRTGELRVPLRLSAGEEIWVLTGPNPGFREKNILIEYEALVSDLRPGERIALDNGLINLEVLAISGNRLRGRVVDGGELGSKRHVNLPGVRVKLPSLSEPDKRDIAFGLENQVDYIALSFVRSPDEVLEARRLVEESGSEARLIAKIENREGVDNFEAILEAADAIMVARGDLGVEVEFRELPVMQRRMVRACALAAKPVIVATHLLESMVKNPLPTRAEVTDVANAVYEGADALMLSAETGTGVDPVRSVQVLDEIARRNEKEPGLGFHLERKPASLREELARSASRIADSLGAPAILVITRHGHLAELVASHRPAGAVVYAITNLSSVCRRLLLHRSLVPLLAELSADPETTVRAALDHREVRNRLRPGDPVVVISDVVAREQRITSIQVRTFA